MFAHSLWGDPVKPCRGMAEVPRGFAAFFLLLFVGVLPLVVERRYRDWSIQAFFAGEDFHDSVVRRAELVPNYSHVWWSQELLFLRDYFSSPRLLLAKTCKDFVKNQGNWSQLCSIDSDGDGLSNGEELGDPCCQWSANSDRATFRLTKLQEYRRWKITHPGRVDKTSAPAKQTQPEFCDSYDAAAYEGQFHEFYFDRADPPEDTPVVVVKVLAGLSMFAVIGKWAWYDGLLSDVFPVLPSAALSWRTSTLVFLASFAYMDISSGMVHLILDYAPQFIPGLGSLARGFQYHHDDPMGIIRISWYAYVSHIHLLIPIVSAMSLLSKPSRVQRLFWSWSLFFAHAFQTAHRWAHMTEEMLSWPVRLLQSSGIILTHERHMNHHQDLEKQFTILSGMGDVFLDWASSVLPASNYDLWCVLGVLWFFMPSYLDLHFRYFTDKLDSGQKRSVKAGSSQYNKSLTNTQDATNSCCLWLFPLFSFVVSMLFTIGWLNPARRRWIVQSDTGLDAYCLFNPM
ncbi:unnamed protein product [Polarella glacialis]|uniref:Lipid desaturase domain-containing protein n=1 Tax=Polarella glacialis TaxID=89957 RepID=A0A813HP06_POLGL|nr:unnamed protein product [Polarella glacialis]